MSPFTVEDFEKMRDGLDALVVALSTQIKAHGYDAVPNSPAERELRGFGRKQSLHTAHGQASSLVEVAADQLSAFRKTVTEPVETIAPYTCVRSLLESAALGCWLLDPTIEAKARVARSLALRYEGVHQQQKWARAAGEDHARAEAILESIGQTADSIGYRRIEDADGKRCGAGIRMPSVTSVIAKMLNEEALYRLLSAVAHGHLWAIHKLGFALDPSGDSTSPLSGTRLRGVAKQANVPAMRMLVVESGLALSRVTWYNALYLGWDKDLVEVLERGFDRLDASEGVRFWRTA